MSAVVISLPVVEAAEAVGVSRNQLDLAIKAGDLVARKSGNKVLVGVDDLRAWFASLPVVEKRSA